LKSIKIPESVTSIGNSAFSGCSSLKSIKIPEGVTSIGNEAFFGCSSLTDIKIPEGVTSIGEEALKGCKNLDVVIDNKEQNVEIGYDAFDDCKSVKFLK
ncbi:MAG: leucine-rich repeat domain-containing protein, partial [Paludibacteraceae bacterium]|nr:leucine-rich repeat domain-containing protein [Paludibacteraceae bacterium]